MEKTVCELFAGVGGFRCGMNIVELKNDKTIENRKWNFVFANQWEPSSKIQHAFDCYEKRFGHSTNHSNTNIEEINIKSLPNFNLLVGGFPCQDYSVARGLSGEKGIDGKKGSLWFKIVDIIKEKQPSFLLLENVDRLLKSPSTQRGRDFAIILRTLYKNGYSVEWRVINAAEYGFAQKRRRVFIFAFHEKTNYYKKPINDDVKKYIHDNGFFQKQFAIDKSVEFPILEEDVSVNKYKNDQELYDNFKFKFENSGIMHKGKIATMKIIPISSNQILLKDILLKNEITEDIFLTGNQIEKIKFMKGAKRIPRKKPNSGETYMFTEGKLSFPDNLDSPARTMLTSEGTTNRTSHVIEDVKTGKLRFLHPIEAERINGFPDNWTNYNMSNKKRYFMMGNALVVGLIKKMELTLSDIFEKEN